MERYSPLVEMIAGSVLANPLDVEEVVQDAFMRAFGAIESFDPRRGRLSTWLGRIAYNTALNRSRVNAAHCHTVGLDELKTEIADVVPAESSDPDAELLDMALDLLDPRERTMLQLVYYADMPLADAAAILDTNSIALAARLYRLRRRLASSINNLRNRHHHT